MAPTFVDLFCGIGGFRIGLEAVGFECVYANDIDPAAVDVYKANRQPGANYQVECACIRDVFHNRLDQIPRHHVLSAGFPCQSFAPMGKNLGEGDPRYGNLGNYVVRIAGAKRPVVVLLENVKAFFSPKKPWYKNMEDDFKEAGYVCSYDIVPAWAIGLPQYRERGLIVAVRADVQIPFKFPVAPNAKQVTLRQFLLPPDSVEVESTNKLPVEKVQWTWAQTPVPEPAWANILDKVPEGVRNYSGLRLVGAEKATKRHKRRIYNRVYHDLGYHNCILGSHHTPWILTRGVDEGSFVIRRLHLHELRRIQGFPDDFELSRKTTSAYRHIGNAVPPQMVEFIGRAVEQQYRQAFQDEDDRNAAKTPRSPKLSRKSKHKSKHKSSNSRRQSNRHKSSYKSSHKRSRKRKLSSGSDEAPPSKRRPPAVRYQTRYQSNLKGTAEFDGNLKAPARK